MKQFAKTRAQTVESLGAAAGCVVHGIGVNNQGIRIKVLCEQLRGHGGALRGTFVILDVGDNKHSHALIALVGQETDAAEVLRVSRRASPSCLSVANANILAPEKDPAVHGPS
jgi:hypothetical protein